MKRTSAAPVARALRTGFTLVELLVVIGIIAVLAGIMMASFGGATDSARAAVCMTNLKNLAQAVNTYGMRTGYYPLAGSREAVGLASANGSAAMRYTPQVGWISWLDRDKYDDGNGNAVARAHVSCEICPFYGTGDVEKDTYAITNGALWKAVSYNRKLYTCPEHVRYRASRKKTAPLWSYVMNSKFGYDSSRGSKAVAAEEVPGVWYNSLGRTDKILLFSELPTVNPETRTDIDDPSEYEADCTLQYKASVGSKNYKMGEWDGTAEEIGFPHKLGKRDYCGHVVFADGHVETLRYNARGLSMDKVTALLCEGVDVAYGEGNGYQLPSNADEM